MRMDTIWARPQERVCVCVWGFVLICLTLVGQISRLYDTYFVVVSFNGMCFASRAQWRRCYFGGPYSVIHTAQSPAGLLRRCVCACVCALVYQGSPLGRGRAVIASGSPGAGYGHPGHVSWVTAKPHGGFPLSTPNLLLICPSRPHWNMLTSL